jgi:hypothetical protein
MLTGEIIKDEKAIRDIVLRDICKKHHLTYSHLVNETIHSIGDIGYGYDDDNEPDYSHMIITFYGGDNSGTGDRGKWARYLTAIKELVESLETEFDKVWLINLDVDCPDDVFSVQIAVHK